MTDSRSRSDALRIILLVPGFPADEDDSTCLPALQSFVEALGRSGWADKIDVIAFQYPYNRGSYTWHGIRVHGLAGENSGIRKPHTWMRAIRRFRRISHDQNGDIAGIIHSFWLGECALVGAVLARLYDWKHVVSIGGQEIRRSTAYSRLLRNAPFVLTVGSEFAAHVARRTLGREIDVVSPLGLDIHRIGPIDPGAERDIDILAVGSLTTVKRFEDVVDVVARVVRNRPDARAVIVGEGPSSSDIQSRVDQAGLARRIRLRGALPRDEVLRLMRRSKILLHPSEYESQGYVFLEALASGMHVVSRGVGFTGGSSKVVHCDTVAKMAGAVSRILGSEADYEPEAVLSSHETARRFRDLYLRHIYPSDFGGTSHLSVP